MFLTNPEDVKKYTAPYRLWQGIPGIEVTKGGRIFLTFYSGGISEAIGNYCLLFCSNDGVCFDEVPIAVTVKKDHRCYDPCLWIDPLGRLWFIWSCAPKHSVWAVICEDPDAPTISFGEPFQIGQGVMLNKPTVLSTGEWLFPIAVWQREPKSIGIKQEIPPEERKACDYKSIDNGKTFVNIGGADVKHRYICFWSFRMSTLPCLSELLTVLALPILMTEERLGRTVRIVASGVPAPDFLSGA